LKQRIGLFILISVILIVMGCTPKDRKVPVNADVIEPIVAPIINTKGEEIGERQNTFEC